ncbi:ABC transporter ATP-binding protein [Acetobacter persici]|uniref:ABC transporter ATP-binding protein n=1 Tax=Acetobacter persici TaxID=1076596 RepID=UPI001BA97A27|nr:ATP-binding cassette domain-containing protein [Acetobacter persici]MBS1016183.1 ATP-binding cassette domain-containing protein [Acetobacter persici]
MILRAENICVSLGKQMIFNRFSISLDKGIYALRGANGVGKSTLLRALTGAQPVSSGEIWIEDKHLIRERLPALKRLSYVPDANEVYPFMTGQDLLDFVTSVRKAKNSQQVTLMTEHFSLRPFLSTRFDTMSFGTAKKFLICTAFINAPSFLVMDEPSNGLDRVSLTYLSETLKTWAHDKLILVATHDEEFISATGATILELKEGHQKSDKTLVFHQQTIAP